MLFALKGVDVVLFAVFQALGCKVIVRPVLGKDDEFDSAVENFIDNGELHEWITGYTETDTEHEFDHDPDCEGQPYCKLHDEMENRLRNLKIIGDRFEEMMLDGDLDEDAAREMSCLARDIFEMKRSDRMC